MWIAFAYASGVETKFGSGVGGKLLGMGNVSLSGCAGVNLATIAMRNGDIQKA
ncbi:hypothetical protein LCGC14_1088930 [marine sediment metagenome]|uniref:Uncharacterized protein n=1 Tax=marine sediment metagenome TaxID=412755 RepID=A0A0F9MHG5_9ZZZZ